jgi:NADH-quinone oxidoreductase subunit M
MPQYAVLFSLLGLAAMGLPPFGVFAGFMGLLFASPLTSSAALLVLLIAWLAASWYILNMGQRLLFGRQRSELRSDDLCRSELFSLLMVVLILIALGVLPASLFEPNKSTPPTTTITGSFAWNK